MGSRGGRRSGADRCDRVSDLGGHCPQCGRSGHRPAAGRPWPVASAISGVVLIRFWRDVGIWHRRRFAGGVGRHRDLAAGRSQCNRATAGSGNQVRAEVAGRTAQREGLGRRGGRSATPALPVQPFRAAPSPVGNAHVLTGRRGGTRVMRSPATPQQRILGCSVRAGIGVGAQLVKGSQRVRDRRQPRAVGIMGTPAEVQVL